jgi:hypothetical protein
VRFELGARSVKVDSGVSYSVTTTQPIVARGADSAATYLSLIHYKRGVSLQAGEKAPEGTGVFVVTNGTGEVETSAYASKCSEYMRTDCLSKFVDPEDKFEVVG